MSASRLYMVEAAVDALIAYLKTNFATKCTAINAAWADANTITAPDVNTGYDIFEHLAQEVYPFVHVLGDTGSVHNDQVGYGNFDHRLHINITHRNTNEAMLVRQMDRYLVAITQMVKEGRGSIGTPAGVGADAYTIQFDNPAYQLKDIARQEDAPTIQRVTVNVILHRSEILS